MALKDITLGQYYPAESPVHKLDPRTKLLVTLAFLVSLFVVDKFWGFVFCTVCLGAVIKLSTVPFKFMSRGLKSIMLIVIFSMIINIFFTPGDILVQWGFIKISRDGLYRAVFLAVRLVLLIFGSSLLTLTTKPLNLTDGMEKLLSPLKKIGLPAHELAMMMSIALRFIPTLLDETDKIMKAQTSRGADFESGKLMERAKSLVPLLVPLFVSAFRIATDLAMAMEARCYHGGEGRTRMNAMVFGKGDIAGFILAAVYLAVIIFVPVF